MWQKWIILGSVLPKDICTQPNLKISPNTTSEEYWCLYNKLSKNIYIYIYIYAITIFSYKFCCIQRFICIGMNWTKISFVLHSVLMTETFLCYKNYQCYICQACTSLAIKVRNERVGPGNLYLMKLLKIILGSSQYISICKPFVIEQFIMSKS